MKLKDGAIFPKIWFFFKKHLCGIFVIFSGILSETRSISLVIEWWQQFLWRQKSGRNSAKAVLYIYFELILSDMATFNHCHNCSWQFLMVCRTWLENNIFLLRTNHNFQRFLKLLCSVRNHFSINWICNQFEVKKPPDKWYTPYT